jgi:ABC-type nitrate/sulfonate/bicarbonate transport system substrate-binding protein
MISLAMAGTIDGYIITPPAVLPQMGLGKVWIDQAKGQDPAVKGAFLQDYVASPTFLKHNARVARKFLAAIIQAENLLKLHVKVASAAVRTLFPQLDEADFLAAINGVRPAFISGVSPNKAGFAKTLRFVDGGLNVPLQLTFAQAYNTSIAPTKS